jgi:hypothetical protein
LLARRNHSNCLLRLAAAILLLLAFNMGCAMWDRDRWNFDRYRDARAVDIEQRLDDAKPIVDNPF